MISHVNHQLVLDDQPTLTGQELRAAWTSHGEILEPTFTYLLPSLAIPAATAPYALEEFVMRSFPAHVVALLP